MKGGGMEEREKADSEGEGWREGEGMQERKRDGP